MTSKSNDPVRYIAGAYHPKYKNEKLSGEIFVTSGKLYFHSPEKNIELPLFELCISKGGANNRLIFFEHPAYPGIRLFTSDLRIMKESDFISSGKTGELRVSRSKAQLRKGIIVLMTLFLIVGVIWALLQLKNPVVKYIAKKIPPEWEQTLGESVAGQYLSEKALLTSPALLAEVKKIADPLLDSIESDRYRFKLYVLSDPSVNAFALPGGIVVINSGLISTADSGEEIAGVIAHEIAHVQLQHGLRRIIESLGLSLILTAVFGDSGNVLAEISNKGRFLLDRKFSRDYEREADRMGFELLVRAKIDPNGMLGFFKKLNEMSREKGGTGNALLKQLSFLSTHPETEERIARLKGLLKNVDSHRFMKIDVDMVALKKLLKLRETK